jgi:hypothetical protein
MGRYEIDQRVGCIAIIDTDIPTPSTGLHSYDEHIVKYWHGVNLSGRIFGEKFVCWHVPSFMVKKANRICRRLNNNQ